MEIEGLTPCQALVSCFRSYGGEDEVAGAAGGVEGKPRIVLMGLRRYVRMQSSHFVYVMPRPSVCYSRSGKSSIQKVVFHKLSPNETLFLESTSKVVKDGMFFLGIGKNKGHNDTFTSFFVLHRHQQ